MRQASNGHGRRPPGAAKSCSRMESRADRRVADNAMQGGFRVEGTGVMFSDWGFSKGSIENMGCKCGLDACAGPRAAPMRSMHWRPTNLLVILNADATAAAGWCKGRDGL